MFISDKITTILNSIIRIPKIVNSYIGGDSSRKRTVPSSPQSVVAEPTINGKFARVSWGNPSYDGGSPVTHYTVKSIPGGITVKKPGPDSGSITVSGLSVGTDYTFSVTATNDIGESVSELTSKITTTGVPGIPLDVVATSYSSNSAKIKFTKPVTNGGRTIIQYTVKSIPEGRIGTYSGHESGQVIIEGLQPHVSHTFLVFATNGNGNGPSASSNLITTSKNLSEFVGESINSRLSGIKPGKWNRRLNLIDYTFEFYDTNSPQAMFSVMNYPTKMERNSKCWANDLDLTGMGAFNSSYPHFSTTYPGYPGYGTLISRRHVIYAAHAQIGDSISFVKKDGTIIPYQVKEWSPIIEGSEDVKIGILSEDVDPDICHYKILPENYKTKLTLPFMAIGTNQFKEVFTLNSTGFGRYSLIGEFTAIPVVGDSGSPVFTVIDNELILLNCWHHGGFNPDGPFISNYIQKINEAMIKLGKSQNLSSDYKLTEIDLSKYTSV